MSLGGDAAVPGRSGGSRAPSFGKGFSSILQVKDWDRPRAPHMQGRTAGKCAGPRGKEVGLASVTRDVGEGGHRVPVPGPQALVLRGRCELRWGRGDSASGQTEPEAEGAQWPRETEARAGERAEAALQGPRRARSTVPGGSTARRQQGWELGGDRETVTGPWSVLAEV